MITDEVCGGQSAVRSTANRKLQTVSLFLVALVIRLAAIALSGPAKMSFGDAYDYVETTEVMCRLHVYPERSNLPFFRAPGLPFFIAAVTACHPRAIVAIKIALAVCDAVTVVLIAMIGASPLAGVVAALNPFFIASVCDVRSEPLFMMLLTAAIFFLLRGRFARSGVMLGLAALTRPVALIAIPLFALFTVAPAARRPYHRRPAGVLLLAALLTIAPWTIRNAVHYHQLIVINDAGGFNLWRGNHPEIRQLADEHDRAAFNAESAHFDSVTVQQAHGDWNRMALDEIRRDPGGTAMWTLRKAWLYWRPWLDPREHSTVAVIASGIFNLLLFTFGAIGIARSPHRRAITIYFIVMWLVQLPYQVVMRFRIPITDPLLIAALGRRRADADRSDRSSLL